MSGRACSISHFGMIQNPHVCSQLGVGRSSGTGAGGVGTEVVGLSCSGRGNGGGPAQGILDNCEGERGWLDAQRLLHVSCLQVCICN